jgi:hypothetical protein
MISSKSRFRPPAARFRVLLLIANGWIFTTGGDAPADDSGSSVPVSVAEVDITPAYLVRMTGYNSRKTETQGVEQRTKVRAPAIGSDVREKADAVERGPFVLVTVENCGVPACLTDAVAHRLNRAAGIVRQRFVVTSTHTHWGPAICGVLG